MKVLLMHRDRDFDPEQALPWNESALTQDLELETLLGAMASGDPFLFDVARKALLQGACNDVDTILYRQAILADCLANPAVVRELYSLVVETIERKKHQWWGWGMTSRHPSSILHASAEFLRMFVEMLRRLTGMTKEHAGRFASGGFTSLFEMLGREFGDGYCDRIENHLAELEFRRGMLLSAELGDSNEGTSYVLRKAHGGKQSWLRRLVGKGPPEYTFHVDTRDEAGMTVLSELQDRGTNRVANALAQSVDHVLGFFNVLRTELAFYVGCLNLHDKLRAGGPIGFPAPEPAGSRSYDVRGLYDVCLALGMEGDVVGNTFNADRKNLVIITGANQGGKSTCLRSIGLAQLMMQCGLFVGAEAFTAGLCATLSTHYRREEDATMRSGKLDEELARMSDIVDHVEPGSMLLFNESFSATNEREGSEIAKQIVSALLERQINIFFVTHRYEFARGFFDGNTEDTLFLRAERRADGTRTFRLVEGEPLETSYGEDLYKQVFGLEAPERNARS